ncbi:MAG TPA: hypothetical protein PL009_12270, partial [Flavipsychrobacter sp.]|nr:hypothetical protein [Flavipsychrobacter sp.]
MVTNSRRFLVIATLIIVGFISFKAFAQDETDALRYSFLSPQGTARSMGFGNALGSVGGDFASLSVNPAGIGIYRRGEMMLTPAFRFGSTDARYLNTTLDDSRTAFNFNNLGIVFTHAEKGRRYDKANWKTVSFGIGVNRTAD